MGKGLKTFLQRCYTNGQFTKRCSPPRITREITTVTYHLTRIEMATIKEEGKEGREGGRKEERKKKGGREERRGSNKYCWGRGGTGTLVSCWWDCKTAQLLWTPGWRLLKKLKPEPPYDPSIPLLGFKRTKSTVAVTYLHPRVHSSTTHNSPDVEASQTSTTRWMVCIEWNITHP